MNALNLFKKDDKKSKPELETKPVVPVKDKKTEGVTADFSAGALVLKNMYVSEKANMLGNFNQYAFKVAPRANKNEVKKQVEKMFKVKVKAVRMINMPEKSRNVGRHSGSRSGWKKAIVALKEGYSIGSKV